MWTWSRKTAMLSGPKLITSELRQSAKMFCRQTNRNFKFFLKNADSSLVYRRGTIQLVNRTQERCIQSSPYRRCIFIVFCISMTMLNHILKLLQQHGFKGKESKCWTGLSAVHTFYLLKTSGKSSNKKYGNAYPGLLSTQKKDKKGTPFLSQKSSLWYTWGRQSRLILHFCQSAEEEEQFVSMLWT